MIGQTFERLTVIAAAPSRRYRDEQRPYWLCLCECGATAEVDQANLRRGKTKSCGCLRGAPSHRKSNTREYRAWVNMITRCENPNTPGWENYGGRGIAVCARWRNSFEAFFADVGVRPSVNHSLDRINVDGNYEPGNCRWATQSDQMRNTTVNRIVEVEGVEMTLQDAVERTSLKYNTVLYRLKRGWSLEQALTLPQQRGVRP
jgi:hypothetical protein